MSEINRTDFAADKSDKAVSPNEILNIRCVRATSGYHSFVSFFLFFQRIVPGRCVLSLVDCILNCN